MSLDCGLSEKGNCIKNSPFPSKTFCEISKKINVKLIDDIKRNYKKLKFFFSKRN